MASSASKSVFSASLRPFASPREIRVESRWVRAVRSRGSRRIGGRPGGGESGDDLRDHRAGPAFLARRGVEARIHANCYVLASMSGLSVEAASATVPCSVSYYII